MANEAVIIELLGDRGDVVRYTVADATGISKGSIMYHSASPRTISKSSAQWQSPAGIAAADKEANDGSTTLGVYTKGIFDLKNETGNTIGVGQSVMISGANLIGGIPGGMSNISNATLILGKCLEVAAANEVVAVKISL
jgi:hypothetical protein